MSPDPFGLGGTNGAFSVARFEPCFQLRQWEDDLARAQAAMGNFTLSCPSQERDRVQPGNLRSLL